MDKLPFVSIVVASYNRKYIIEETISSVLNQNYDKDRFEVLLVDNNSSDGTVNLVQSRFENELSSGFLKVISLKYNSGSSGSYCEALAHLNSDWSYVLKMDEDLILDKNCLAELVNEAVKSKKYSFIGGKVFFYKERNRFHAIGSFLSPWFAIAKGIGVNELDKGQFEKPKNLDGLNGCMLLISREIYDKVGWFDTDYFLYYDDHDLMYKSSKAGFKHRFTPKAIGYHDTLTGSKKKYSNKLWLYYSSRGSILFLKKNFSFLNISFYIYFLMHNLKYILGIFYIFIFSNKANLFENFSIYLKGYLHGLQGKTGNYDLDKKGIKITILSGGRGSGSLSNGLRLFARENNLSARVTHITNAYDDGKSTGEVRRFFGNSILGPSDVRKIQEKQYSFFYDNKAILSFFSLRLQGDKNEIISELKDISENIKPKTKYVYEIFLDLPFSLRSTIIDALKNFFRKDYDNLDLEDFAFSNLIYASLADLHGGLQEAEEIIRKAISLPDHVILNSTENGYIFALTEAGKLLRNEAEIVDYSGLSPIYEVYYSSKALEKEQVDSFNSLQGFEEKKEFLTKVNSFPPLSRKAKDALASADILIYGPGTQYSSLYPTYFTENFSHSVKRIRALKIFISNVFHDNETPGFSAVDQIRQAIFYLNQKTRGPLTEEDLIDVSITNDPSTQDSRYIMPNRTELEQLKLGTILIENVESKKNEGSHDPQKISNLVFNVFNSRWK